ncbi:hypothetical protein [Salinispora sp. H7-4]|uniref:hypothetical protein n=1 Tax=Salinispora sp. H7-4 TaxID=2748321 RepID=UPI0015D1B5A4|nr:hypothetical protein [Salinispora sp. H7-4]NYT96463.1 hypothetical protein [Salinispora sp. H7-4]
MTNDSPVFKSDSHLSAIVHWSHHRNGRAHCLVRLYRLSDQVTAVASEIRSNSDSYGIADDMAGVAMQALELAQEHLNVEPRNITWIAHHGNFSYYDAFDPDTFTAIPLTWDGYRYQDRLEDHRLLTENQVHELLGGCILEPVPATLAHLGWPN